MGSSSPTQPRRSPREGTVIAVGNGKILENGTKVLLDVKAGDKILFGKYSGTDIASRQILPMRTPGPGPPGTVGGTALPGASPTAG